MTLIKSQYHIKQRTAVQCKKKSMLKLSKVSDNENSVLLKNRQVFFDRKTKLGGLRWTASNSPYGGGQFCPAFENKKLNCRAETARCFMSFTKSLISQDMTPSVGYTLLKVSQVLIVSMSVSSSF